ncbi:MAG TPA: hypothetical protein VMT20_15400 [Terriglobia bacterium]|nr:hypothetical protein [Terriglobia bacterium]
MLEHLLEMNGQQLDRGSNVRVVRDLRWAQLADCPFAPQKHSGARLAGLRFEKAVWKKTGGLHNPWIEFEDANGSGFACPDIVLPERKLIVECKLTYTPVADMQLAGLYLPLAKAVWGEGDWRLVVACKRWAGAPKRLLAGFQALPPHGEIGYLLF